MRVMVVANERFVVDRLRTLLRGGNVDLSTTLWSNADVRSRIVARRPELLLLDTAGGAEAVIALLESLDGERPVVAFLAADDHAAANAYDAGAVDYLVKPLDAKRVSRALGRAREELDRRKLRRRLADVEQHLLERCSAFATSPEALWVRGHGNEWLRVAVDAIDWAIVQDDYVCLNVAGRQHLLRTSLDRMLADLARPDFVRIHRAIALPFDRVAFAVADRGGNAAVVLHDGRTLPVGRVYARGLPWRVRAPAPCARNR